MNNKNSSLFFFLFRVTSVATPGPSGSLLSTGMIDFQTPAWFMGTHGIGEKRDLGLSNECTPFGMERLRSPDINSVGLGRYAVPSTGSRGLLVSSFDTTPLVIITSTPGAGKAPLAYGRKKTGIAVKSYFLGPLSGGTSISFAYNRLQIRYNMQRALTATPNNQNTTLPK